MINPKSLANLKPLKPGQSGNPGGKPVAARNRLTALFTNHLADDFEQHGKQAIIDARTKDPLGYIKAVAGLMPKQFEQVEPLDDMTDAELAAGIAILRGKIAARPGAGSGETETLQ